MDDDNLEELGQVSPQEAMRRLVELRLRVGPTQFRGMASQMGMPGELLDYVEQAAGQVEERSGAPAQPASGLVDASGRPLSSSGGGLGLVDASGRPIGGGMSSQPQIEEVDEDEDDETVTLSEEESQRLFQELIGVRMIVGPENFVALAREMGMPAEATEMVEGAAAQIEDEIAARYEDQDEAMTVRLVNARMMMGQERFADLAEQVGMPEQVVADVEQIAAEIESGNGAGDDEDESATPLND